MKTRTIAKDDNLYEIHCAGCGRLLGKVRGEAELKCHRCGSVNKLDTEKDIIQLIQQKTA